MKDVISETTYNRLSPEQQKEYEFDVQLEPFKITCVKKTRYYGNPDDIVKDKTCNLDFLEGAQIQKIGFHRNAQEGGLAIEYTRNGETKVVVLGFTDLGMWVYADVPVTK